MKKYLLTLLSDQQPRRIRVVENVLKNKKTVANLFWAKTYNILPWLGAAPHLERRKYELTLQEFRKNQWLQSDQKMLQLTEKGRVIRDQYRATHYWPHFFDYYWVTNPKQIERRTLFAIQALSELAAGNKNYAPLAVTYDDAQAVKYWLLNHNLNLIKEVEQECLNFGHDLAKVDVKLAELFSSEMVGHHESGMPAVREANILGVEQEELAVMRRDLWLALGKWCLTHSGELTKLLRPLLSTSPLPHSAQLTFNAYQNGYPITKIAASRHLKISTIREHLLAAAILTPDKVDWDQLLPSKARKKLSDIYTGPVSNWQYANAGKNDPATFFYFRLFQIWSELNGDL